MPTFFVIGSKDNPSKFSRQDLINAGDIIFNNRRQSNFLSDCGGCEVITKPAFQGITILIKSIYCFDQQVNHIAKQYILDYLKMLGLDKQGFEIIATASSPMEFSTQDLTPTFKTNFNPMELPGLSVKLKNKDTKLDLYTTKKDIQIEVTKILDEIKKIEPNLTRMGIFSNADRTEHTINFSDVTIDRNIEDNTTLFVGDIIFPALLNLKLEQDYEINGFNLENYKKLCNKRAGTMMTKTPIVTELTEEEKKLYESNSNSQNKIKIMELFKKHNVNDENYGQLLRRIVSKSENEDLGQFLSLVKNLNLDEVDDKEHNRTALHWAVVKGNIEGAQILVNAGAKWDIKDKNGEGKTALNYAEEKKLDNFIQLFTSKKSKGLIT